MADQSPFTIVEEEEKPTDDVLVRQQAQSLTIPETKNTPVNMSVQQDFNKVDVNLDKMLGLGYDLPFITKSIVQDIYKYQDADGNYQRLPSGYYDVLKRRGLADQQILADFANVRNVGPFQQFMEQAAVEFTANAPATVAFTSAGPAGILPAIGAGLFGYLGGDMYRRMMAPELDLPYANKSGLAISGQIFGGSVPGFQVPWLAEKGAITLGSNFIDKNLKRMPFATPTSEILKKGEGFIERGLEGARANPLAFTAAELRDVATASAIGGVLEEQRPGERGAVNVAGDILAETTGVLLDPIGRAGRVIHSYVPGVKGFLEGLSPDRRLLGAGRRIAEILENSGNDPEEIIRFLRGEGNEEYLQLLEEAGIPFEDRTSALQTGVPILYYLEGLGRQASGAAEFAIDPAIQNTQQNARRVFNQFLGDLLEFDTPESLALYANMRDENFRLEINDALQNAYNRFNTARENALKGGEAFDEKRRLYNIFFGEDGEGGVYGDIRRQSRVLRELIPKNIPVSQAALKVPEVDDEPIGPEGLIDVYNRLGQELSIRGERPRLSYGSDLVSLDKVLREFDAYVNPPDASDVPELPSRQELFEIDVRSKERQIARKREEAANAPGDRRTRAYREQQAAFADDIRKLELELNDLKNKRIVERAAEKTVGEPTEGQEGVTTGELLNMLDVIGQSKRNAMAKGNQNLLGLLNQIETGVKNSLAFAGREAPASSSLAFRKTSPGGQFQVYFDNYLAFEDEVNNVFSQAFTGQMRRDIAPEMAGYVLFDSLGDTTLLRLRQMDDAANFLMNYDSQGFGPGIGEGGRLTAANEFATASGVLEAAEKAELDDAIAGGASPMLRFSQERLLKGLLDDPRYFRKIDVRDADGNFVLVPDPNNPGEQIPLQRIEAQDAFNRFINDPAVDNVLSQFFPTLRDDLQDVNALNRIFENTQNRQGNLNREIAETDAFVNFFQDRFDNPISGLQAAIGSPGQERVLGVANPVRTLRAIAQAAAESGDQAVKDGLLNVVLNHGYTYAGGFSPLDSNTGLQPFSVKKMLQYLNDPMIPGQRDSILDVLQKEGILEGNAQVSQINAILREMDKIDASLAPGRGLELDPEGAGTPPPGVENLVRRRLQEAGVGFLGAGIGANMYGLLAKAGIVGGTGTLIFPALGANLARDILSNNPAILTQTLMTEMLKNPELMADILERSKNYKPGDKISLTELRRMYTFLLGGGLVPAGVEFREFARNVYGGDVPETASERQERERQEARAQRQQVTPPPQASAPQVAPPPVARASTPILQTPAPTAQASPVSRQQYAAAFPDDFTSDLIRSQGIGSLSG